MKKALITLLCLLMITGCSSNSELSDEDKEYNEIVAKIENQEDYIETQDYFNLDVSWQQVDSGMAYIVTLDETKIDMYDLMIVTYGGEEEDDILPNVGIYDDESYHLIVDYVDKSEGYYKGLQLSGLVDEESDVLIYIHYYSDLSYNNENELYIKVSL